ncbi:PTS glucitol/sorbitol transporter subunit IIA [Streptococcus sobrinus]|uniref:PTS glucitol/sorbitol transporter subunit IIA n=1 Tax=Streptococcus sobrinus TaxID=1310 RepID=UPI000304AC34|nr:PTS glucitol/sorbitol transporter subunit IIA [Streptococcus sobrinus]AWN19675.1 PTS sorbitol transporter subunit IIA [Streptococcus sobrinus]AWN62403.1 PTS sorbitol transporter subunit IIA [Streptococcus sobrinus]AWN64278.1 PTS sorbitol transporter subunit IIA [Streptococcus sobrinus]SQG21588.1 PTS system sorbitol-specific transporter subunit IIA [Streptococcus sobrinus]
MAKIFETKVLVVGPEAQEMIDGADMMILFGEGAPQDLAEYCFMIDNKDLTGPIQVGGHLVVDGQAFPITSVGDVVEKNLINLGHITISFDGDSEGSLPGTLHVSAPDKIQLSQGSLIQLFND